MRQNYLIVKTQDECKRLFASTSGQPITRVAFQGLDMPQEAFAHTYKNCLFLACRMPRGLKRQLTDSLVFPEMGELFTVQSELYTASTLYAGYQPGNPRTFKDTYDQHVYQHYLKRGKRSTDIKETLARTLHDHSISMALHEFLSAYPPFDVVGVMGGHSIRRDDAQFATVAHISKRLTESGKLMISGGGPGAMEATHLGAWMAGRTDEELAQAIRMLSTAPEYTHPMWLDTAMQVRLRWPQTRYESVGIPTWLYGHESATPLATRIAKYFDNSIREDGILTLAMGGIVFTPGSAGTLQEIFQEAVQDHYLSFGTSSPMIFLGVDFWTKEIPVYPLIQDLLARGKYKNLILGLSDDVESVVKQINDFRPAVAGQ
ncbi:MAG: hypothetical protein K2F69_07070 [Bacteroidaceae bacterium]|nr:hypothetical protein [Bacteroidaceae bacterium]